MVKMEKLNNDLFANNKVENNELKKAGIKLPNDYMAEKSEAEETSLSTQQVALDENDKTDENESSPPPSSPA